MPWFWMFISQVLIQPKIQIAMIWTLDCEIPPQTKIYMPQNQTETKKYKQELTFDFYKKASEDGKGK